MYTTFIYIFLHIKRRKNKEKAVSWYAIVLVSFLFNKKGIPKYLAQIDKWNMSRYIDILDCSSSIPT